MELKHKTQERNLNLKLQTGKTLSTRVGNLFFEKDDRGNLVVWVGGRSHEEWLNGEATEELKKLLNTEL